MKSSLMVLMIAAAGMIFVGALQAQGAEGTAKKPAARAKRRRVPKVFQPIKDVKGLPRVLLIGDSISMGYTQDVRQLLAGKANVHRIPTNGGPTTRGLAEIEDWLGKGKWDVIHFNWGLHDLKYMGPHGENLANPKLKTSHQQVPPKEYAKDLSKLVARLKKTGAKLIWASTTPVPVGAGGRIHGDSVKYNAIALKIMKKNGVQIDDLYTTILPHVAKVQRPKNVHFFPAGYRILARQVANSILKSLGKSQLKAPKEKKEK